MRLAAGTRLGPYLVQGLIHEDAMEHVYRARYTHLDSDVALKVAQSPIGSDHFVHFLQQWRTGSLIGHSNVLAVYDFGWHEGRPFIVLGSVEGETLQTRLTEGALTPTALSVIGIQV